MHLQYDQILHYMNVPFIFFVFRPWPLTLSLKRFWKKKKKQQQRNNHFSKIVVKINILV